MFEIGSPDDQFLTTAIAHEYLKCKDYFDLFVENETRIFRKNTKGHRVRSYNLYTSFLVHLYEFYYGCFKRDRKSFKDIHHLELDLLINAEAQKILNILIERIETGRSQGWENDISVYKRPLPEKFAEHFRWIRNRHSHVDPKRASGEGINLSDFYAQYHMYIYLMFSFANWLWDVKDLEKFDFKDIEKFSSRVATEKLKR